MDIRTRSATWFIGLVAGACLFAATALYVALQLGIGVPAPPVSADNAALFAWWRPLQWLTTSVHLFAGFGLAAIGVLGIQLSRVRDEADDGIGLGGAMLGVGGVLTAVGQLVQMGGNRGVLDASKTTIDPGVLGAIGYTTDSITQALYIVGYAGFGVGVLAISLSAVAATDRFGRLVGVVFGVALLGLSLFNLTDPLDLADPLTGLIGLVLAPVWLWRLVSDPGRSRGTVTSGARPAERPVQPS